VRSLFYPMGFAHGCYVSPRWGFFLWNRFFIMGFAQGCFVYPPSGN
jgi:hypothetical protein